GRLGDDRGAILGREHEVEVEPDPLDRIEPEAPVAGHGRASTPLGRRALVRPAHGVPERFSFHWIRCGGGG
ncbi:MAG: hypothetical protein H6Q90_4921, partial [Deltaproteobacteria bacterium]|nr:hypothetical protein [Deltaproteobacteria bacterium]